ncbi:hemolysin secretion protein D [Skermanella stibiiresistens SB22]|uniref:Hemolysin secretion protein D n=1 Tax=Skermanella stibiiresistens SB22 TaxID=1385369 RepID=W9H571_9PROT|nr:efflux RND transporter periplasmic adaptor subunit [Skermanella stibiiresistens]EWY41174.1 hemolysin secretion protein D [Skermanella stibiiresistens SB22]
MSRFSSFPSSSGLAVAALIAALGLGACSPSESASNSGKDPAADPRIGPQLVRVATVQPAAAATRGFTGTVSARVQGNLGFRVSGKVIERLVDTGQSVRAGQPLMRIDRAEYAHAIAAQIGNVAAAKAKVIQAAADEARYRGLVTTGAVSKAAYDQAKAAVDGARALLSAAEAQLKVAEDDGDYATLVADADGTVVETLAEPGQVVTAGQVVARLAHAGPREAAISLPETLRPALGSVAEATLYGAVTRSPARLRQLSDAADPVTRTYDARYVLEGDAARAPLGATVTVHLTEPSSTAFSAAAGSVPLGAITDGGEGPGVWVLDEALASVSFRPVRIREIGGESVVLDAGVGVGDKVVALGGRFLHEGQSVRVDGGPDTAITIAANGASLRAASR